MHCKFNCVSSHFYSYQCQPLHFCDNLWQDKLKKKFTGARFNQDLLVKSFRKIGFKLIFASFSSLHFNSGQAWLHLGTKLSVWLKLKWIMTLLSGNAMSTVFYLLIFDKKTGLMTLQMTTTKFYNCFFIVPIFCHKNHITFLSKNF